MPQDSPGPLLLFATDIRSVGKWWGMREFLNTSNVELGGAGTVTSVAVTSDDLDVDGSPITDSGTITLAMKEVCDPAWLTCLDWTKITNTPVIPVVLDDLTDVNIGTAANGQVLIYNGTSSKWENQTSPWQVILNGTGFVKVTGTTVSYDNSTYITGNQTITLTGDIAGIGTTSISTTLADTAVSAGAYGDSTNIPVITVDSKGRITDATTVSISTSPTGAAGGDLTGTYPNPLIEDSAWSPLDGFSIAGFSSISTQNLYFKRRGKVLTVRISISGTSNSNIFTFNLPNPARDDQFFWAQIQNNGGAKQAGMVSTSATSNVATVWVTPSSSSFAATGTKGVEATMVIESL